MIQKNLVKVSQQQQNFNPRQFHSNERFQKRQERVLNSNAFKGKATGKKMDCLFLTVGLNKILKLLK